MPVHRHRESIQSENGLGMRSRGAELVNYHETLRLLDGRSRNPVCHKARSSLTDPILVPRPSLSVVHRLVCSIPTKCQAPFILRAINLEFQVVNRLKGVVCSQYSQLTRPL